MPSDRLLAIQGNLQTTIASRRKGFLTGLKTGTKESSTLTKRQLRRDVEQAGFARRVATTIRDQQFPKQGLSYSPTALIYSKIPRIMSTLADGPTIRPNKAQGLAIPIPGGPAARLRLRKGEDAITAFKKRFGQDSLFAIKRKDGTTILAARLRGTASGAFRPLRSRKATKTQGERTLLAGLVTVPVFTLARQAKHQRRLRTRQIFEKAARRHPDRLVFHIAKQMRASEEKTKVSS